VVALVLAAVPSESSCLLTDRTQENVRCNAAPPVDTMFGTVSVNGIG